MTAPALALLPPFPPPPPETPSSNLFFCDVDTARYVGVINVGAEDLPDGTATVYRINSDGSTSIVRGGADIDTTTGGFVLTDTEAPFNTIVSYIMVLKPIGRVTGHNWLKNPSFEHATVAKNWTAGSGRQTMTVETRSATTDPLYGTKLGVVHPNTGTISAPPTAAQRTLLWSLADSRINWKPSMKVRVTGQVLPEYPVGGNTRIYVGFVTSVGTLIGTIAELEAHPIDIPVVGGDVITFDLTLTTPTTMTAGGTYGIGIFQDAATASFALTWRFDAMMLASESLTSGALRYFDGATTAATGDPGGGYGNNKPGESFAWTSGDASYSWMDGTSKAHDSASAFIAATMVGAYTTGCMITAPESLDGLPLCEPVALSDPILPQYFQWLGLLSIGALTWSARRDLLDVLGRNAPIALSEARATPSTEFRFMTRTLDQRKQFLSILMTGRVLLLRNPDPSYPETDWYISIGDVSEERIATDHREPMRRWVVNAQVVDRPAVLIVGTQGQTWQMVYDNDKFWSTVRTGYPDWLGVFMGHDVNPGLPGSPGEDLEGVYAEGRYPTVRAASGAWVPVP